MEIGGFCQTTTIYIYSTVHLSLRLCCRTLTGYLLDPVDHHKGIGQAHLHRVIDGADL